MRRASIILLPLLAFLMACSTVPITGRKQLNIIPAPQILSMSFQQYEQFLSEHKVITGTPEARMVQRVGQKIQNAVERYFSAKGMANRLSGYQWEFHLVEDPQINAWCMPGGKVVVYTGILPITQNETGLAVVMGHEIAHAVAEHGNERMSQGLLVQLGGLALSKALEEKPEETRNLFLTAFGIGSQVGVLLPYSRLHEKEADHLGLIFMAMAGYDPREAVKFWERMAKMSGGNKPPEFLSTHPSDETRIKNLKKILPDALKYYKK
ncbi:M48 family metallopeptidase [Caldithrix abyssi]|uniref:Peptidase M48 Ste24p n=1 Tax=Caldithrix abyssi DSM 13497 TaxID=880073 RepID=H1XVQ2_CALAY|nr:M48 family metallopeptidase [Caldithrix abyssi]APF20916.1 Peptidase family M48 [Caldithrix abyssi DSM 13497]EHO40629.1 peptidase M48 Ste24p [Caldithrix abyssi DSM 13497]